MSAIGNKAIDQQICQAFAEAMSAEVSQLFERFNITGWMADCPRIDFGELQTEYVPASLLRQYSVTADVFSPEFVEGQDYHRHHMKMIKRSVYVDEPPGDDDAEYVATLARVLGLAAQEAFKEVHKEKDLL